MQPIPACHVTCLVHAGKNRPLDPDELEFLDMLAQREADEQARIHSQEQADLEAYRQAVAAAAEAKAAADADADGTLPETSGSGAEDRAAAGPTSAAGPGPASSNSSRLPSQAAARVKTSKPLLPTLKPVVKVKPKGAPPEANADAAVAEQRGSKRPRLQHEPQEHVEQPTGLAGLLGDYASDSE